MIFLKLKTALVYLPFEKGSFKLLLCSAGIYKVFKQTFGMLRICTLGENRTLRFNFPTNLCTKQNVNS